VKLNTHFHLGSRLKMRGHITHPYVFMVWCLINNMTWYIVNHRGNFAFNLTFTSNFKVRVNLFLGLNKYRVMKTYPVLK